jgi:hypothetical protein
MLEGKQAGVRPLVLARFSTWQLGLFFCFDTGKTDPRGRDQA